MVSVFKVSKVCKLHMGTRRRDVAVGSGKEGCLLSIYSKGNVLLGKFLFEDNKEADEWRKVLQALIDEDKHGESATKDEGDDIGEMEKKEANKEKVDDDLPMQDAAFVVSEDIEKKINLASKLKWETIGASSGLRIQREYSMTKLFPCLKISCEIPAEVDDIMDVIVNSPELFNESLQKFEIIEKISEKCCIQYAQHKSSGWFSSHRDSVLKVSWGLLDGGMGMVTMQSTGLVDVPVQPGFVRMKVFLAGYLITPSLDPLKKCCNVHYTVHGDLKGWIGAMPRAVAEKYIVNSLAANLLGLRDLFVTKQYVPVEYDKMLSAMRISASHASNVSSMNKYKSMRKIHEALGDQADEKAKALCSMTSKMGSFDPSFWTETPIHDEPFKVRGKNYLKDHVKIKTDSTVAKLVAVDLFETTERVDHIASRDDNLRHTLQKSDLLRRSKTQSDDKLEDLCSEDDISEKNASDVLFIMHFQVPGPPFYSLVLYFSIPHDKLDLEKPFGKLFQDFVTKNDESRDTRVKLIPRVVEGNWFVKKTVGETPAILGKKLKQRYYGDGETYVEVDCDVGSSSVARSILGVVKGYAKTLSIDLAILLESHQESELPEELIGSVRLIHPDLDKAVTLV